MRQILQVVLPLPMRKFAGAEIKHSLCDVCLVLNYCQNSVLIPSLLTIQSCGCWREPEEPEPEPVDVLRSGLGQLGQDARRWRIVHQGERSAGAKQIKREWIASWSQVKGRGSKGNIHRSGFGDDVWS